VIRGMTYFLSALAALNVLLLGTHVALSSDWFGLYPTNADFPALAGIGIDDARREGRQASCHVIRITADNCRYCAFDQTRYARFAEVAERTGCDVVSVAPFAGAMARKAGEERQQLKFVSMELGEVIYPFATPQTIVLDASRRVRWHRYGMFDDASLEEGLTLVQGLGRR
jgi:hypothetical protein